MQLDLRIQLLTADHIGAMKDLLQGASLPLEGVDATNLVRWGAWSAEGQLVGAIALERYTDGALLRSLVVAPAAQRRGLGAKLVETVRAAAGASPLFLLTMTAADWFERLGFERCNRTDVPVGVRAADEFTSICPDSATVMRNVARSNS